MDITKPPKFPKEGGKCGKKEPKEAPKLSDSHQGTTE